MNKNQKKLLNYAYALLARRRYTLHEMVEKLYSKNQQLEEPSPDCELQEILAALVKANFLNDQDYIYFYIESQLRKKPIGINKILAILQKKGLEKGQIRQIYSNFSINELEQAKDLLVRKIGNRQIRPIKAASPEDLYKFNLKIKQKYFRYLQSRGFSSESSLKAISSVLSSPQFDQIDL